MDRVNDIRESTEKQRNSFVNNIEIKDLEILRLHLLLTRNQSSTYTWMGVSDSLESPASFSDCLGRRVSLCKVSLNTCLHYRSVGILSI